MEAKAVYVLVLSYFWELAMASFRNNFSNVTRHTDLLLEWDHSDATEYPLVIHAIVLNKTDGYGVNAIEADISIGLTDGSFLWGDLPFPLPFLSTATYKLQVLSQQHAGGMMPHVVVASSPPFTILPGPVDQNGGNTWQPTTDETANEPPGPTNSSHSEGRPNSDTAIAAGLVVPFVVGIAAFIFLWVRRRQKRVMEEQRKARAGLVID
ncbi:hypothetical protein NUW58_g4517 [Xylaria curta]|uniref:Uncharacterized protein n=1 Tax=Xylaria curta TaxID=42375 RepID=A0ACC1P7B1_9PEZI|nr:hypothetical protein NUW58_g4517 [Xylaria curta]